MTLAEFDRYRADVEEARREAPSLDILFGVEADYYPGCEAFLSSFLAAHPFDLVLGSIHFRDYWSADKTRRGLSEGDPTVIWREYYQLIGDLAETGLYDVVTHMDLPKRFGNPGQAEVIAEYVQPALDRIAKAGMAIEINTSGWIHSIREPYPSLHVLRWAAERGIGLVFGSDAHSPDRVGDGFVQALALVREAGFTRARRYRERCWTEYELPAG